MKELCRGHGVPYVPYRPLAAGSTVHRAQRRRLPRSPGTVSATPVLTEAPRLTATWWGALRTAIEGLSTVRTERTAVRQAYLDRAMPKYLAFLCRPVPTVPPAWSTAHSDLHWANLAGPQLSILDREGWGMAPAGYDAALLHAYSLAVPETAERVRRELSDILASEPGRFAELLVITELLQSAERGTTRNSFRRCGSGLGKYPGPIDQTQPDSCNFSHGKLPALADWCTSWPFVTESENLMRVPTAPPCAFTPDYARFDASRSRLDTGCVFSPGFGRVLARR